MEDSEFTVHTKQINLIDKKALKRLFYFLVVFAALSFNACNKEGSANKENAISGDLMVFADEAFKPVLESEEQVFESLYPNAKVQIEYLPETQALNALLNDSVDFIVIGRDLTDTEKDYLKSNQAIVNTYHFATDALAFLSHEKFNNSLIQADQLKSVLNGNFKTWQELDKSLPAQPITLVFDNSGSSNLRIASEKFGLDAGRTRIFAAGSNKAVADYVKENPNTLGVIGAAWLSDEESPSAQNLRTGLEVLKLQNENGEAYAPFQSSLYYEDNPFTRRIHIIRRNKKMDVGTGFASFLLSDRGQRIVLKSGILPAIMPEREIVIK